MSRENVEVVRGLLNDDVDIVQLDQATSRAEVEAWMGPWVHPDFEAIDRSGAVRRQRMIGLDEWRQGWREWLQPWESYRVVSEELIDMGDKVVVLDRSYGRRRGLDAEVCRVGATVYTFRDGKIARIEYLVDRDQALEAVGRRKKAISQPTPETISAAYDAFNRRDIEAWQANFAEDCEAHDLKDFPDTEVYYGHAGQRAWLAKIEEVWSAGFKWEPMSFLEGDGVAVVETRATGTTIGGDVPTEVIFHLVLRFRDDKVVWSQGFLNRADALEVAGLSE